MKKLTAGLWLGTALALSLSAQDRSFNGLFPNLSEAQRARVFSPGGLVESGAVSAGLKLRPAQNAGIQIAGPVLEKNPAFLVEFLTVVPGGGNLLAAYNALGRVRNLKGRLYHSDSRNAEVALFEDATRIESLRRTSAIPDPPSAVFLPPAETMYLRLKDINFGNSFYRNDITSDGRSLQCRLVNVKNLSYGIIPIIKEEQFVTRLYVEPLAEGLMIYTVSGADVSGFVASRIDVPSAIRKRVEVIVGWLVDGVGGR